MSEDKESKYGAYALRRQGKMARWLEIGDASMHSDGKGCDVYVDRLPVGGFSGHILVRAKDAPPPEALTAADREEP
jgi:hypothetical protein